MSAPISVVVPVLGAEGLGPCLAALAEGVLEGAVCEVILADAGLDPRVSEIAEAVGAALVTAEKGRGRQLAAGAEAARGAWLLVVHGDTVLGEGWARAALAHLHNAPRTAGYARLAFDDTAVLARLTAGWANLRSALFGLPYGDQGLLISAALYREIGGYRPLPLMEDVDLVRRLGRARLKPLATLATTSAERYRREGWLRRGGRNLGTLALYLAGVSPERLLRRYERR
ncbi:MAG: glycosyltransferase [Pseudomonadota bacterium]